MMRAIPGLRIAAPWLAAFIALGLLGSAGCSSKGKSHEPAKLQSIDKPELKPDDVWSHRVGNGSGKQYTDLRIALGEDAIYVASLNGRVQALNPLTGAELWQVKTKARLAGGPAIDGDLILLGTLDAEVIALKRADGKELWRARGTSEVLAPPAGAGKVVVMRGVDGHIYGLDVRDGHRLWSFDRNVPTLTLRGLSAPLVIDNRIYAGLDNGHLVSLALDDGQLAWEQALSVASGRNDLDRVIDIDADLLPAQDGLFAVTFGSDLALIDPQTGQSRWRRTVKSYSGMAIGGDKLFVTDADGVVWALDAETGAQAWKAEGLKYRRLSPPVYFNGYVVVGDYAGYLHWLKPGDGSLVARTRLGRDPIVAPPMAGSKYLYVMNAAGKLAAYEAPPIRR